MMFGYNKCWKKNIILCWYLFFQIICFTFVHGQDASVECRPPESLKTSRIINLLHSLSEVEDKNSFIENSDLFSSSEERVFVKGMVQPKELRKESSEEKFGYLFSGLRAFHPPLAASQRYTTGSLCFEQFELSKEILAKWNDELENSERFINQNFKEKSIQSFVLISLIMAKKIYPLDDGVVRLYQEGSADKPTIFYLNENKSSTIQFFTFIKLEDCQFACVRIMHEMFMGYMFVIRIDEQEDGSWQAGGIWITLVY